MVADRRFRRAFSTLGCPDLGLDEVFSLAARFGLDAVEIRALGGSIDLPAYFSATYGSPDLLAEKLRGRRIPIVSLDTSLRLIGATETDRAQFLEFVRWAEALGIWRLRVLDGGTDASAQEIAEAVDSVRWWRALRESRKWRADIMVETHDALTTSAAILDFVAGVPDVAVLWDTHHTWRRGGEEPLVTWHKIKRNVVHLHVTDSVAQESAARPYAYVLPGSGEFPMSSLRPVIREEFAGFVSLEWEKYWIPELAPLEAALASAETRGWW